jgi:hypothetical protein
MDIREMIWYAAYWIYLSLLRAFEFLSSSIQNPRNINFNGSIPSLELCGISLKSSGSGYGPVTDSCLDGNEHSDSIKGAEGFD